MSKFLQSALFLILIVSSFHSKSQQSVAREWNEVMLEAIRNDFARPTVHARNLFHTSAAMYEAWAAYDQVAEQYFLGEMVHGHFAPFDDFPMPSDLDAAQKEAISYAAYRVLTYRFINSPGQPDTQIRFNELMDDLGYDKTFTGSQYEGGNPAALGNYIANVIIDYGKADHANEQNDYENTFYEPVNPAMNPRNSGNPNLTDPNRWQPLSFESFIDQSGNEVPGDVPEFLGPEWGSVMDSHCPT